MFAISKEDENQDFSTESLRLIRIHFYSFLSVFSNFKIYFRISSLFIFKKNNDNFECFLHTSPMPSMLRWFLYFTTRFKNISFNIKVADNVSKEGTKNVSSSTVTYNNHLFIH